MSIVQIAVVADVPDDQQTAAQAAAAAFVATLPDNAEGTLIVAATFGGVSLIPTAQDNFDAALDNLRAVTSKTPRASADDVAAAVTKVDDAARALELSLSAPAAPAPADVPAAAPADPAVVAATVPAPIGEDPAPAPADVPADVPAGTPIG